MLVLLNFLFIYKLNLQVINFLSKVHSTSVATGRPAFCSSVRKDQWNLLHHPLSYLCSGQKSKWRTSSWKDIVNTTKFIRSESQLCTKMCSNSDGVNIFRRRVIKRALWHTKWCEKQTFQVEDVRKMHLTDANLISKKLNMKRNERTSNLVLA